MRALALLPLLAACAGDKGGLPDPARPPNPTCLAPARPETGAGVSVERAWPALSFEQPVSLLQAPDDARRWFVVEQTGRVMVFDAAGDTAAADVFLDLAGAVEAGYSETGLLGVAFHPDFADNGEVYVSYTRPGPLTSVLSRFTSHDGGATLDPASEEVLLTVRQPYSNHNGGHVAFGPDGYLYLALGDGGSAGDPEGNGQDTGTLLGKMLRIDVDGAAPYGIPADNPFADGDGGLPEIYAWGLRNTWKFSFDTASGVLWAGDVGQDRREEVDVIENGGNYGWNRKEGTNCYEAPSPCDGGGLVDPVVEYTHAEGESITGGFVYRGTEMPAYEGVYFYADYVSGTVWALLFDEAGAPAPVVVAETGFYVSSFAQDTSGELYLLDYLGGGIRRLVAEDVTDTGTPGPAFPETLAATGCFDDDGAPVDALLPYEVNAPLWSDGAAKQRWFALPDGASIEVDDAGDFVFPVGTVLAKRFALDGETVETRLFVRHDDGEWAGYTYAGDGGAAALLAGTEARTFGDRTWVYPSRAQCLQCHTGAAGRSLGLEVAQVDRDGQIARWEAMGLFAGAVPAGTPLADPAGDAAVEDRARAYLHANCSSCHRPEGTGQGPADFRVTTALADMAVCGIEPQEGDLGVSGAVLVDPGSPETSLVSLRMHALDANRMPEVGTSVVDVDGAALVDAWIGALERCP